MSGGTGAPARRRERDDVAIRGDYQARALESPWAVQRFWHAAKIRLLDRVAPGRPGLRIADAGCGSGVIARHLAEAGAAILGMHNIVERPVAVNGQVVIRPVMYVALRPAALPKDRIRDGWHVPSSTSAFRAMC